MADSITLSLADHSRSLLPSTPEETYALVARVVAEAQRRLDGSAAWPAGKSYQQGAVATRSAKPEPGPGPESGPGPGGGRPGPGWHLRESVHAEPWEWFQRGLLQNHSAHETQYIHACRKAVKVHAMVDGLAEVWQMFYKLGFPASDRDFVVLIVSKETTPPPTEADPSPLRSFLVVSIPVACESAQGHTRARYVSVEECKEERSGDQTRVRWRMCVQSEAGGWVPRFLAERSIPSKISEDVPSFLAWAKEQYRK